MRRQREEAALRARHPSSAFDVHTFHLSKTATVFQARLASSTPGINVRSLVLNHASGLCARE